MISRLTSILHIWQAYQQQFTMALISSRQVTQSKSISKMGRETSPTMQSQGIKSTSGSQRTLLSKDSHSSWRSTVCVLSLKDQRLEAACQVMMIKKSTLLMFLKSSPRVKNLPSMRRLSSVYSSAASQECASRISTLMHSNLVTTAVASVRGRNGHQTHWKQNLTLKLRNRGMASRSTCRRAVKMKKS